MNQSCRSLAIACLVAASILPFAACGDDETSPAGGAQSGGGGAGAGAGAAGGGDAYAALYDCEEVDFAGGPLQGPGFDATMGGFIDEPEASYVVATTQIYVADAQIEGFLAAFGPVNAELASTEGLVAHAVGTDSTCGVNRTMSVWTSEQAMFAFVGSGAHALAMSQTNEVSLTGRVTHFTATAAEVEALDWEVVRAKLAAVEPSPVYD